ncbi:energy transducer TonB [Sphingomonas sp. HF-S3]|uniref:Energy transducer TonB n=1 Tax=Sphingomonas rustica TaxID=3103142 RepID=A0ABV0BAS2_9SPHN
MYANRSSLPFGINPAGLGGALVINGLIVSAMIFLIAPKIVPRVFDDGTIIEVENTPPPPPPVTPPKPEKRVETVRETKIVTPEPLVPPPPVDTNTTATTSTPTDQPPPIPSGTAGGTSDSVVPPTFDPPAPPPLIKASIDSRYAKGFQPDYPASELRAERSGTVSVRVLIGTDGRVKAVERISATTDAFFNATRSHALSNWRFKPATRGGVAQEEWKVMNVRFNITDVQ